MFSIAVEDNGVGISEQRKRQIFMLFGGDEIAEREHDRPNAGILVGLGLTTSQKLCSALNCSLHFSSLEGAGSTFHLDLLFSSDEAQEISQANEERLATEG